MGRKKTWWEEITEPSSYELNYQLQKYDERVRRSLWWRHCGERMWRIHPYEEDSFGRLYRLRGFYYCDKCHCRTLNDMYD